MTKKKKDKGVFVQTRVPTEVQEWMAEAAAKRQWSIASFLRYLIMREKERGDDRLTDAFSGGE